MPSRAFPANTAWFVRGIRRNSCAVSDDLMKPTSDPIASAASCAVPLS
jgi:hypothetical protein